MTKTSKKIVFFGNERIATGVTTDTPILRALVDSGYEVAAVVANYERGKSRNARDLEIATVAKQHGIPVLLPEKPGVIADQLRDLQASAGVLVAYGRIIPQSIIDIFPRGIINLHPSLLPRHRGPTPLESVLLSGEELTGISIMALTSKMDAGPVYAQSEYKLSASTAKQQLADDLLDIGRATLLDVLPGILDGSIVGIAQDESVATYDRLITKAEGLLDPNKSPTVLEREIRAFLGWPGSRITLGDLEVIVTQARAAAVPTVKQPGATEVLDNPKTLLLYCSEGYLSIERLKPSGKKDMSVEEFLRGYGNRLGN